MRLWKRICIIVCLILSTLCSATSAAQLPKRWVFLDSNSKIKVWYDSESITEEKFFGDNRVYIWMMAYFTPPEEDLIETRYAIDLNAQMLGMTDWYRINRQGEIIETKHFNTPYSYKLVVPGSRNEKLYKVAKAYHERHST